MNRKIFAGSIACAALFCIGGAVQAQGTPSGSSDSAATSSDTTSSTTKHAHKRKAHSKTTTRADASNGSTATPSGGIANPKDVSPGTYNQSGGATPTTSDPMQTKNARDGSPLPSTARAQGTGASGARQ